MLRSFTLLALISLIAGCAPADELALEPPTGNSAGLSPREERLRILTLAVAVTNNLRANYDTGTQITQTRAAVQQWIDDLNAIFEPQLGLRLNLNLQDACIETTNGPLTQRDQATILPDTYDLIAPDANLSFFESCIGSTGFEIGIVLGDADIGVPVPLTISGPLEGWLPGDPTDAVDDQPFFACSGQKAALAFSGAAGARISDPEGVINSAHLILHALGATHTFSGLQNCANRVEATAVEPGAGRTLMSSANNCALGGPPVRTDQIHSITRAGLSAFFANNQLCGVDGLLDNRAPVITVSPRIGAIPRNTPFALEAAAVDPDEGDSVFFSWEQINGSPNTYNPSDPDDGLGPLFAVRPLSTSGRRQFPADLDSPPDDELLPTVDRLDPNPLRFRILASDERSSGGAFAYADVAVPVSGDPFGFESPPAQWTLPSTTFNWSVGGSAAPPVSCAELEVQYSVAGAPFETYATVPNTGSTSLPPPLVEATGARLRLKCVTGIFFDETMIDIAGDRCDRDADCSNDNVCDGRETCSNPAGVSNCVAGTPLECDDGLFCNGTESCDPDAGCRGGVTPSLDDGFACTVGVCDEEADLIVQVPVNERCADDLFCNGAELCEPGLGCIEGTAPSYDDGDPCTTTTCNEDAGALIVVPVPGCGDPDEPSAPGGEDPMLPSPDDGGGGSGGGDEGCRAAAPWLWAVLAARRRKRRQ